MSGAGTRAAPGPGRTKRPIAVHRLGRTEYTAALERQRRLQAALRDDPSSPARLLLTEHEPVFTLGRNHPRPDLRVPAGVVAAAGIPIVQTERGGDITYHGPGQLVVYPIVNLRAWGIGAVDFVAGLEECAIRLLAACSLQGERRPGARGVWLSGRKIASVGINIRGGVSMHGIAINLSPNLEHFAMINACGLPGVEVTSVARERGTAPRLEAAEREFTRAFAAVFRCRPLPGDSTRPAGAPA